MHAPRFFVTCATAFAVCAFACGCGGGGGGAPAPSAFVATPSPSPSPTPSPSGALTPSASTAALTAAGQAATVTVSEAGYTGAVVADASACGGIASVAPPSASAPATFAITALGSGACTVGFVDGFGQHAGVTVGVTITQGAIR